MTDESERAKFEAWAKTRHTEISSPAWWGAARDGWLARAQSSGPVVAVSELEDLIADWSRPHAHTTSEQEGLMTARDDLRDVIAKHTGRE